MRIGYRGKEKRFTSIKARTVGRSFETRGRDIARSKMEGFLLRLRLDFDHCAKVQRGIYVLRGRSMKMFPVLWNEFSIVIKYCRTPVYRISCIVFKIKRTSVSFLSILKINENILNKIMLNKSNETS